MNYARSRSGDSAALKPPAVPSARATRTYLETFNDGPGGSYADRHHPLPVWDGVAYCHSPWWLDANHAPPGGGYLHLLLWTFTDPRLYADGGESTERLPYLGSRFAEGGYSRNLTHARVTVRLRGEADLKGAKILLLVQAQTPKTTANLVLTGQPFQLTREWTEQTVTLTPDAQQWTCLGARHDMQAEYGCDAIATVLRDVNVDIIFVLFPVQPVPAWPQIQGADLHRLRAVEDYPVLQESLPKGLLMFDTIKIEYPD